MWICNDVGQNLIHCGSESFVARSRGQKVTFCSLSSQRATVPVLLPPWNRRRLGASFACSPAVKACGHVPLAFAEFLPQRGEAARDQARLGSEGRATKCGRNVTDLAILDERHLVPAQIRGEPRSVRGGTAPRQQLSSRRSECTFGSVVGEFHGIWANFKVSCQLLYREKFHILRLHTRGDLPSCNTKEHPPGCEAYA